MVDPLWTKVILPALHASPYMERKVKEMESVLAGIDSLLHQIVDTSRFLFQDNLVGIDLHGSLAMNGFNPKTSDIDLILVCKHNPVDQEKRALLDTITELNGSASLKSIELSIVEEKYCQNFVYPTPCVLHFSKTHLPNSLKDPKEYIQRMQGTDKDLGAHFTIIKKYGLVLYGQAIEDVFGPVPQTDYLDSILADLENAADEILDNPIYVVLNLCRTLAFIQDHLILSKKQGGQWALNNLPSYDHALIGAALAGYE